MTSTFDEALLAGAPPQALPAQAQQPRFGDAREVPEGRFHVAPVTRDTAGVRTTMRTGPWMLGPDGHTSVASLGVLVDDAIGVAVFLDRPVNTHSVTAEISLDVVTSPPWSGPELLAQAEVVGLDADGGVSRCDVRDGDGRLVAVASGRCRFTPIAGWEMPNSASPTISPSADYGSVLDVLEATGGELERDGELGRLTIPSNLAFQNASRSVHGGILLCVSELATTVLGDPSERTASVRMNFVRPAAGAEPCTATAETVSRGRTTAVYRVTTTGPAGKPYTIATITRTRPSGTGSATPT